MSIKKPLTNSQGSVIFMRCFAKEVIERLKNEQRQFVSEENVQLFNHGVQWQSHNSSNPDNVSTMQHASSEITVKKTDLISYNVGALEGAIRDLTGSMTNAFLQEMYSTIGKACESNGQTVDNKGRTAGESFIAALEKIEFGLDRQGKPVFPDIHVGPDSFEKLKNDPSMHTAEIKLRIEELTERKQREALERERTRLAKYKVSNV